MRKSVVAVLLLAGSAIGGWAPDGATPAHGQSRELIQLQGDIVRLQHQMSEMQAGLDARNQTFQGLVEQIVDQLATLTGSVGRIDSSLEGVQESQNVLGGEMRVLISNLRDDLEILDRNLTDLRTQMSALSQQVTDLNTRPSSGFDSAQDLMGIAEADFFSGNYSLATEEFRQYIALYPRGTDAPQAQLYIGNGFFEQGAWEQAIVEYDLLLQNYPNSDRTVTALLRKGLAFAELGRTADALRVFDQIVSEHPDSREAITAQERTLELR